MTGHGWGGKTRKKKSKGGLRLWKTPREKMAPARGRGNKNAKTLGKKDFHEIDFPNSVFGDNAAKNTPRIMIVWISTSFDILFVYLFRFYET